MPVMKRTIAYLIVLLGCLAMAGTAVAQEPVKIGVSIPAATHGWLAGVNHWAGVTKERLHAVYPNIEFIVLSAESAGEQSQDLSELVEVHGVDAVVILPIESEPLTEPVRRVKGQGLFVTVVDRELAEGGIEDLYVAGNNRAMGRVSAHYIVERLGGSGRIVVLRGLPTSIDDQRFDAFMDVIATTDIDVLAWEYANWNRNDGYVVMQSFLARFPQIDAVWAQDDDIAIGVIEAVQQAGRGDELFIVPGGGIKEMVERVMAGDALVPVTVSYPPSMIATAMEVTALRFTSDAPISGEYVIDSPLITPENAADFHFPDSPF